jgi:hypothetical protein
MSVERNADGTCRVVPRPDLLRRGTPEAPIEAAIEQLHAQLAVATELTENLGDGGREGIYKAIIQLVEFLAGQGIPRAALYPLQIVAGALVDADRGVSTAAFKPQKPSARPPLSVVEFQPRALRAVIAECCIRQKQVEGAKAYRMQGAELAASLLRNAGWTPSTSAKQLLQLREEITSRERGDPMRSTYEEMLDSPVARARPLAWAKLLADHGWVNQRPRTDQLSE